jgi:hypothetical protein
MPIKQEHETAESSRSTEQLPRFMFQQSVSKFTFDGLSNR